MKDTIIHALIAKEQTELVMTLVTSKLPSIDTILDESGNSALIIAAEYGRTSVVEQLLQANPTVDMQNKYGETALHKAMLPVTLNCAQALLSGGAKRSIPDAKQSTPLHRAAAMGRAHTALLLHFGADCNAQDNHGLTPLHVAAEYSWEAVITLLVHGADSGIKSTLPCPHDFAINLLETKEQKQTFRRLRQLYRKDPKKKPSH